MQTAPTKEMTCCGCHLTPLCHTHEKSGANCISDSLPIKRKLVLKKNEALFTSNSPFQYLYTIEQGAIKTVQVEADGSELIRNFYFSGDVLGYKAIYSGRYHSTAKALCETRICVINYPDFLSFLQSHPTLQQHILHIISLQMNMGLYLTSTSADRKLAAFLLDLSSHFTSSNNQYPFQLPMSRQDIANYLRLTPETVSRIFKRLQQHHMIEIEQKNVRLLQPDVLKQIAEGLSSIDRAI